MNAASTATPFDPDDPCHAALLASDPLDWARGATLLVYERHATALAARADRRARQFDKDGDHASAESVRRDAVNLLRHACTNYEELVAYVAAHYGHGPATTSSTSSATAHCARSRIGSRTLQTPANPPATNLD